MTDEGATTIRFPREALLRPAREKIDSFVPFPFFLPPQPPSYHRGGRDGGLYDGDVTV